VHITRLERIWLTFGIASLVVFLAILATAAISEHIVPPSNRETIDPTKVAETPPWDHPGIRLVPGTTDEFEAYIIARYPAFTPHEIDVPVGAKVTFYTTSTDVVHGLFITDTDVNLMVVPGWISAATHVFQKPGHYLLLCNEYCGVDHHYMYGAIEVH
jgi:cytochrome c oxidase subunit II